MTLRVLHRPLWHYMIAIFFIMLGIFALLGTLVYFLIKPAVNGLNFIYIILGITMIFTIIGYFYLWNRYVDVKPSASFAYEWNDGPWLHYVADPKTSIVVNWITKEKTESWIKIGLNPKEMKEVSGKPGKKHNIYLNDLLPDHEYYYQIQNFPDNQVYSFKTAPKQHSDFKFVVLGDSQNGGCFGYEDWGYRPLMKGIQKLNFDLILHVGDASDQGNDLKSWHAFFEASNKILPGHPMHIAVGNHDTGTQYLEDKSVKKYPDEGANFDYLLGYNYNRLNSENRITPFKSRYYSFDYSSCRFLMLDTQNSAMAEPNSNQWKFIKEKLSSCPQDMWKIVFHHRTLFERRKNLKGKEKLTITKYGKYLIPIYEKYGVDLVICGHSHNYQNIEWINPNSKAKFQYFVSGGSGNHFRRNSEENIDSLKKSGFRYFENSTHYLLISVNNQSIEIKALYPDNSLIKGQITEIVKK